MAGRLLSFVCSVRECQGSNKGFTSFLFSVLAGVVGVTGRKDYWRHRNLFFNCPVIVWPTCGICGSFLALM